MMKKRSYIQSTHGTFSPTQLDDMKITVCVSWGVTCHAVHADVCEVQRVRQSGYTAAAEKSHTVMNKHTHKYTSSEKDKKQRLTHQIKYTMNHSILQFHEPSRTYRDHRTHTHTHKP